MNLAALRTELWDRGLPDIPATRADYFINRSYLELCEEEDWPFLETSTTQLVPYTFTDMRTIASVIDRDSDTKLEPLDRRILTDLDTDLTTTGTPSYYYIEDGTILKVYPANATASISIRYWKFPTALSADTDSPVVPTRFHDCVVDGAAGYAYAYTGNWEVAEGMFGLWERAKARMRDALLSQQHDRTDDFIVGVVDHQDA